MYLKRLLAERTQRMSASAIRETLKITQRPGVISLAGGLPAPESFPLEVFAELCTLVLQRYGPSALQYGPSEGFMPLREALAEYVKQRGIEITAEDVIIMSGSQGCLDAIGKVLISKGNRVALEAPTYLGAISAFNPYEPEYVSLETDEQGLIPESLEEALTAGPVKFVYLVPTFQNPTGRTIPLERRQRIAEIIIKHDALLVEDDPYSALRCWGEDLPPIKTFAPDNVAYTSTMSKVLSPGLRIGFCIAPTLLRDWMVLAKQGTDLHTSSYDQAIAAEYISGGHLKRQLPNIINVYRPRQLAMLSALARNMPPGFRWSKPEGGMFIWVEGPKGLDTEKLYWQAIEKRVAYVPGQYFFTEPGVGKETLRLNYTNSDVETLGKAVRILAEVIATELELRANSQNRSRHVAG